MSYTVPYLTKGEVDRERQANPRPVDCPVCARGTPVDHWPSVIACRSSYRTDEHGVERLIRVHCTCDYCF